MNKYLIPQRYVRRVRRLLYERFVHDATVIERQEAQKFLALGFDRQRATEALNVVLQRVLERPFNPDHDSSHWLLFSALRLHGPECRRILELGTYDGTFTRIVATLFPEARITTVDLPKDDPILRRSYNRGSESDYARFTERLNQNLAGLENVDRVEINSVFLLDKVSGPFDIVWVDAGHLYPEVAWDLCLAHHLARPEGWILCDDVIANDEFFRDGYVSTESFEVLRYLEERTQVLTTYFLKRRQPALYAEPHTRKWVACLRKRKS